MSQLKGACIIGQSGGPTSVINASAYGAIKTALENDSITRVLGALNGIKGVLDDNLIDMGKEDPAELALMKPTAFIVNTARGGLIDEDALVDALEQDKLAGAALDVFAKEPLANERVMNCPKISLTPHIGGSTKEAQGRIGQEIVEIIENFFQK